MTIEIMPGLTPQRPNRRTTKPPGTALETTPAAGSTTRPGATPVGGGTMSGGSTWAGSGGASSVPVSTGGVNSLFTSNGGGGHIPGTVGGGTSRGRGGPSRDVPAGAWTEQVQFDPGDYDVQQYEDSALAQARRTLDPMWADREAAFQQRMVSQGIQPGTAAYDAAHANFTRAQNDAYNQAMYGAQQQGLAAQNQFFSQGLAGSQFDQSELQRLFGQQYGYDQLANALAQTQAQANATLGAAHASAAASRYGADQRLAGQMAGYAEQGRQFDDTHALSRDQFDMNSFLDLGNQDLAYGNQALDYARFNAGRDDIMYNRLGAALGPAMGGGGGGTAPLDVMGAYDQQRGGEMANYQADVNATNQRNQQYAQAASMALMIAMGSDEATKDKVGDAPEVLDKIKKLRLDTWKYKGDDEVHTGPYAAEFNEILGKTGQKINGTETISVVDAIGVLFKAVQELTEAKDANPARA